jgi:hypothetical protein
VTTAWFAILLGVVLAVGMVSGAPIGGLAIALYLPLIAALVCVILRVLQGKNR